MSGALYVAGLGDTIRICYESAGYKHISETITPVPVIVASHNSFTMEIFRYHRNARNFILYDLAHKYEEFLASGLRGADINKAICEFAGVSHDSLARGPSNGHVPVFDAPDNLDSTGHIVFQPFAGNMNYRTLPQALVGKVVNVLRRLPCRVYIVTRSYIRGAKNKPTHDVEDARCFAGGNITVLEHLSVPASLNLIKTCRTYVGSWSSLHQAAWCENKPVAVFYPVNYHDVVNRTHYAFGMDRENTLGREFPSVDADELESFLSRW